MGKTVKQNGCHSKKSTHEELNEEFIMMHQLGSNKGEEARNVLYSEMPQIRSKNKGVNAFSPDKFMEEKASRKVKLPKSWDWRNVKGKNFVSPAKNQGACGSCVAFSIVAALESHYRIERNLTTDDEPIDFSEASLFFPAGCSCSIGWQIPKGLREARDKGVCDEVTYPYRPVNQDVVIRPENQKSVRIRGFDSTGNVEEMKRWLVTQGPLVADYFVYEEFYSFFQTSSGVYHKTDNCGKLCGGHAICVIGYDDKQEAWLCKNSWGGNKAHPDGCFLIGYGECKVDDRMYIPQGVYYKESIKYIPYDATQLFIDHQDDQSYVLSDGHVTLHRFANTRDAINGYLVARRHQYLCQIGTDKDNNRIEQEKFIFEYFSGNSGLEYLPQLGEEDYMSYDPTRLRAVHKNWRWYITDGRLTFFQADDLDDALAVLDIMKCFTKMCFVGRDFKDTDKENYMLRYFS